MHLRTSHGCRDHRPKLTNAVRPTRSGNPGIHIRVQGAVTSRLDTVMGQMLNIQTGMLGQLR
jgi:hypothetical protein